MTRTLRALTDNERRDWLRLARTETVGPVSFHRLLARFGDAASALDALPRLAQRAGRASPLSPPSGALIDDELDRLAQLGGRLIGSIEPDYPSRLRQLNPPPPLIGVIGPQPLDTQRTIAIVGARSATALGRRFARDLARELGEAGVTIVSGLARGIDGAAHEGSLETGSIAVVAGGLDVIYPPEHEDIHNQLAVNGAIVSERALGLKPTHRDFPRRNRLISGLADGVVVVEATQRSGSLITARYAGEQGREVMAAPGHPADPRAAGPNLLIKQGAALIESADDVLNLLASLPLSARRGSQSPSVGMLDLDEPNHSDPKPNTGPLGDRLRARVLELLSATPTHRDELVRAAGAPASDVAAALMELELAGRAMHLDAGFVCLRNR